MARATGRSPRRSHVRKGSSLPKSVTPLTVGDHVRSLLGDGWQVALPPWPPDAFAAAAPLLRRSDSYSFVVTNWAPRRDWVTFIDKIASNWRGSGYLPDAEAAEVVKRLKSPRARQIGHALLGKRTTDEKVAATVSYLEKLASNGS